MLAEDYRVRRSQYIHRIDYMKQSIENLQEQRSAIPSKQMTLTKNMIKMQSRMLEIAFETERVRAINDNEFVTSHVIHGSQQTFAKPDIEKRLQLEYVYVQSHV